MNTYYNNKFRDMRSDFIAVHFFKCRQLLFIKSVRRDLKLNFHNMRMMPDIIYRSSAIPNSVIRRKFLLCGLFLEILAYVP